METTLHQQLKQRYATDGARQEVVLGDYRIDVVKGDEQLRQYGLSLSGPIKANHSSYSLQMNGGTDYTSSNLLAATPEGQVAEAVRQPSDRLSINLRADSSITKDHALRFSFARNTSNRRNLGVGGFNLASTAYRQRMADNTLRLSENGPLGKRFFTESRLQVRWTDSRSTSSVEAPTIRVNDAFTTGGAQQAGGQPGAQPFGRPGRDRLAELGVEVTDERHRHRAQHARVDVARAGAHQQALGKIDGVDMGHHNTSWCIRLVFQGAAACRKSLRSGVIHQYNRKNRRLRPAEAE